MGNVKMRITIDVESDEIVVKKVIDGKEEDIRPEDKLGENFERLENVTQCDSAIILKAHNSPDCIYIYHRKLGWIRVCT